jgi:hypothetical protein
VAPETTTAAQLPNPASPGFPPTMDWALQLYAQLSKRLDGIEQKLDLILASTPAAKTPAAVTNTPA